MPLEIDWVIQEENELTVERSEISPLKGNSSFRFFSTAAMYTDSSTIGFRKSASVCLREDFHPKKGIASGRIRTLIQRNSSDLTIGWSGLFFLCDQENIGDRLNIAQSMYQITDKDGGTLKLLKFSNTIPSLLTTFPAIFPLGETRAFEIEWNLVSDTLLSILVRLGTTAEFSSLVVIGTYSDTDTPHTTAVSEGLFAQTLDHAGEVDYQYDDTKVIRYKLL